MLNRRLIELNVDYTENNMVDYKQKRIRTGKTEKDRKSGAKERAAANMAARREFDQQTRNSPVPFPVHACNGKKNRHRWTGKCDITVVRG